MNIKIASQENKKSWDTYVTNHPDAAPYSLFAWRKAVENAYQHKPYYLMAEEDGRVCGVLPLINFSTPFRSKSLISLPYCDIGDIIADSPAIKAALIETAVSLTENKKATVLEIRSNQERIFDFNLNRHLGTQTGKVRMLLALPDSSAELWDSFKSKLRSQIRKSEKNSLSFRWGTITDLSDFYQIFSRNMRDLGSPVHSKKWIKSVVNEYGNNCRMGLVYKDKQPVGCGIILFTNHTVSVPWASTLREFNRFSPNMMLYWNFLKYSADNQKKVFDFGRSTPNEGTWRFKKQWGAKPEPLYWYRLSSTREAPQNSSTNRKALAGLWSKLPLPLANILGPIARKYISL